MALEDFFEDFQMYDYVSVSDGLGGFEMQHVPGAHFRAGIDALSSSEAKIAGRVGNKAVFTIVTLLNVELEQNDVVLRLKDGRKYRITGNAIDNTTPDVAEVKYREVTAEVLT